LELVGQFCSELINFIASMAPSDELHKYNKIMTHVRIQSLQTHEAKKQNKQDIQILNDIYHF